MGFLSTLYFLNQYKLVSTPEANPPKNERNIDRCINPSPRVASFTVTIYTLDFKTIWMSKEKTIEKIGLKK